MDLKEIYDQSVELYGYFPIDIILILNILMIYFSRQINQ